MLLKKIEQSHYFLKQHQGLFRCPKCHSQMKAKEAYGLSCSKGHQYDLSKKGTLHFLTHTIKTDYDKDMLRHRQKMIQTGMYQPLMAEIATFLSQEAVKTVVDMGCGEGSFLTQLAALGVQGTKIGFDISKDGVALSTDQPIEAFWCVADITNLPFVDQGISHLLNIFSPSHYDEFRRVLAPGGKVIKVVPEAHYLTELRQLFYQDVQEKQQYSNEKVVKKFSEEMTLVSEKRITYQVPIKKENQVDLLKMSPLQWGASSESLKIAQEKEVKTITIDVLLLIGEK